VKSLPFGRYLLLDELARGGMAVVYRAVLRDSSGFEKQVALKRVLRELGQDPEFVTRFTDEARIVSTLNHSNIAQVFDFGQVDGEHFLAMELVDGPDLGTLLTACVEARHPVPIPTAVYVVAEMARGLGAAHTRCDEQGQPAPVIHRDVSPQNLLISRAGAVKVVDFGIAKAAEKELKTRAGMIMGKCRYMSPEQAAGEVVDQRTDVFATGSVLFETLTGRPLFDGTTASQVLREVVTASIPLASRINPEIPPELDEILGHALARDLDARYVDSNAMARELEALLHRMAPDYSCDDLARFVQVLVPPRLPPEAVATQPGPDPFCDTLLTGSNQAQSGTPPAAGLDTTLPPLGPVFTDQETHLLDTPVTFEMGSLPEERPAPATSKGTSRTTGTAMVDGATPDTGEPESDARPTTRGYWIAAVLLGLLALGLGLGARVLTRPETRSRPLSVGRPLRHRSFALGLQAVTARQGKILLRLEIHPGNPQAAAWLALVVDGEAHPPLCWIPDSSDPTHLNLLFVRSPGSPLVLRFAPPGGSPILARVDVP